MEISADTISPRAGSVLLAFGMMHGHEEETPQHDAALLLWLDASERTTVAEYRALTALSDTLLAVRKLAFMTTRDHLTPLAQKRLRQSLALISSGNA